MSGKVQAQKLLHPELFAHHEEFHDTFATRRALWKKVSEERKDHINNHTIESIKSYNELLEKDLAQHNEIAMQLCAQKNIAFYPLLNSYQIPVPAIGKNAALYHAHDESIDCDTSVAKEDYCQCCDCTSSNSITSIMKPESCLNPEVKQVTISKDMIPEIYQELFE